MNPDMEVIKEILLKHDPTIKEELEAGLDASDNLFENIDFLNELVNNKLPCLDSMDIVLISDHLMKLEKKYYGYPYD